ncbi:MULTISPECIES: restriction endonuclease subunit S [unclassified Chryseobacterium]|uniref:restriction endonuclease subunit S n=1 Tax=unclassified Chryseobacterium TaxID=2593645 RepID=UPI0009EBB482|nr:MULTISPECIES: restriction endonuclease subunit S [unclassified Chryseobacterium]
MSYKKLGKYIKLIDNRNRDLSDAPLLGVSVQKRFITSIANTIGSDMSKYKLIEKNNFVYIADTSRRGDKIGIALLKDFDKAMISQAYTSFKIIDENELSPDYLMMWFSRPEFDRYARYHSIGSVREVFDWKDMCEVELPIPSIEEQSQIVAQYQSITNKIKVNEQICEKLEATAQALYKHWFVDFEFPNEAGKPYKSSDGKMVWNEELGKEIPEGWEVGSLGNICSVLNGYAFNSEYYSFSNGIKVLRGENVTEKALRWDTLKYFDGEVNARIEKCFLRANDIVIGMDGSKVGKNWSMVGEYELPMLLAQRVACLRSKESQYFLYQTLINLNFEYYCSQVHTGTSIPHISTKQIENFQIIIPTKEVLDAFEKLIFNIRNLINNRNNQNQKLAQLLSLLLSRLAVGEEVGA